MAVLFSCLEGSQVEKMAKGGGQKKKKVTSNRGFSTVSVASVGKKKDIEEQEEIREAEKLEQEAIEAASKKELEESNNLNSNNQGLDHSRDPNEWDNEAMEKHSLQLLVEKVRTGIDKEVSRMGKVSTLILSFTFLSYETDS